MRAIDSDALKEEIDKIIDKEIEIDEKWTKGLKYSLKIIDGAPTLTREQIDNSTYLSIYNEGYLAGLKERTKESEGEWVRKEDDICYWYECSKCGRKASKDTSLNFVFSKYCPDCGTRMKGGAENG